MKLATLVLLAFGLSVSAHAADVNCKDDGNYPEITKTDLKGHLAKGDVFVVDVNSDESFAKAKVDTAVHYGKGGDAFVKQLPADKGKLIVAYCGGPACTAWKKAAMDACGSGYKNVRHFKGGISGWVKKS